MSEKQFQKPPEPKSSPKIILPEPAKQPAPAQATEVFLVLNSVAIEGSTVFSDDQLASPYRQYLGQKISLQKVFDIAGAITQLYSQAGYALCLAYVPAQEIDASGQVRITVVEGYIATVEYTGKKSTLSARNKRRIEALRVERPLRVATLERLLLLVNDTPGTSVTTTLDKGRQAGATTLIVDVQQKRLDAYADVNNRGSKLQGPWRYELGAGINHFLGQDDRFAVAYKRTFDQDEQQYIDFAYSRILNDQGTVLSLDISGGTTEPGLADLRTLEYETESQTYQLGLSHPIVRSRSLNFSLFSQFNISDNQSELLGNKSTEANIRSLRLGFDFDVLDRFGGQTWIRTTLSRGLDILNATEQNSELNVRANAEYEYTALRADLYRTQFLGNSMSYLVQGAVQVAADPLVANEQCSYGGGFLGRAYDSSEISGDHCAMAGIELRWHVPEQIDLIDSLMPYLFWSGARTWLKDGEDHSAQDFGAGMRLRFQQNHELYIEVAKPLDHDVALEGDKNARVFAGLRLNF